MPGPVPKRSAERRRRNKESRPDVAAWDGDEVEAFPPDPEWDPIALRWYDSLSDSGQSQFYEPSDWAAAFYVAELMSRSLASGKINAQLVGQVMSAMTDLLTTEGSRRRARLEIERLGSAPLAPVDDLDAYRNLGS